MCRGYTHLNIQGVFWGGGQQAKADQREGDTIPQPLPPPSTTPQFSLNTADWFKRTHSRAWETNQSGKYSEWFQKQQWHFSASRNLFHGTLEREREIFHPTLRCLSLQLPPPLQICLKLFKTALFIALTYCLGRRQEASSCGFLLCLLQKINRPVDHLVPIYSKHSNFQMVGAVGLMWISQPLLPSAFQGL